MPPVPPRFASLPEQIAESLAEAVIRGDYRPGEAIPEQSIADRFGVSRGPVREAFRILERDGVLDIVPRHGARVTKLSVAEVVEIYEIRARLYGLAAGFFAERRSEAHLAALRERFGEMSALLPRDGDDVAATHARISATMAQVITAGCGNARLAHLVHQMARQIARYTVLGLSSRERRRQSVGNWRRLIAAAKASDARETEAVATQMVLDTLAEVRTRLRDGELKQAI